MQSIWKRLKLLVTCVIAANVQALGKPNLGEHHMATTGQHQRKTRRRRQPPLLDTVNFTDKPTRPTVTDVNVRNESSTTANLEAGKRPKSTAKCVRTAAAAQAGTSTIDHTMRGRPRVVKPHRREHDLRLSAQPVIQRGTHLRFSSGTNTTRCEVICVTRVITSQIPDQRSRK